MLFGHNGGVNVGILLLKAIHRKSGRWFSDSGKTSIVKAARRFVNWPFPEGRQQANEQKETKEAKKEANPSAMRVIPVIDLMGGCVVRGIAGRRSEYRPIESQIAVDSRPATIARTFVEQFGFNTAYVADLDAISGQPANIMAWKEISQAGLKLWLDAGVGTPQSYRQLSDLLLAHAIEANIVVALECLRNPDDDDWWDERAKANRGWIFSLDLREGVPVHRIVEWRSKSAIEVGRSAHARFFHDIIVLDVADVGVASGTRTVPFCKQLIAELHPVRIIAGGGVRGVDDLKALAEAGCDAALVASALHDGRLTREQIGQVENLPH
jgi:phosphoribosylformimino-5-aminoimidazole carboxamide ribotide isomerase